MSKLHAVLLILIMAIVTISIRGLPFIIFKKHTPIWVIYLGQVFPYAIMTILLIYTFKDIAYTYQRSIATVLSCILVFILHKWRHSTILSILGGTILYMVLVQTLCH
ncbi:branched-chain amino acid transporter permease [Facklamia miroungae]|uniref:Branched-chain amino acid transport protein AzlD n=1 Tax=Facklamia miroungae TaxID=120956 RepID=A0A1G7UNI3_9LACT|nr:AzlD domain-containing protein [Facklamia miroungae]NKZ30184.1 branched-chain amino acid transporter AzlD [Facklamia miroungae]SDG49122.1 Branched-chain amino acid transport protein AzlD [Facklamia miroungae]